MSDDTDIALRPNNSVTSMQAAPLATGGLISVEQQRALGELQGQIMLAKLYPRDQARVIADLKRLDCTRIGLAQLAEYSYSRGGQDVSGPSIRIMEAIARRWGNLHSGVKELSRSYEDGVGYSECLAFAWDLESGFRDEKQFRVRHVRDVRNRETRKMEQRPLSDERDIYELVANYGARRKRSCLEAVIPGDVVEEVVEECRKTLHAEANTGPEAMKRLLAAFAQVGVSQRQIERRIQRNIDAIRPAQVVQLRKVYAAIKDGMTTPQAEFETLEPEPRPERPTPPAPPQAPPQTRQSSASNLPPAPPPEPPPAPLWAEPDSAPESRVPETFREQPMDNMSGLSESDLVGESASEFAYPVLDENGEPIDGEVHLDPLAWAQQFMDTWNRSNNRTALQQQNTDAMHDAMATSPEADALLDGIIPPPEPAAEEPPEVSADPDEQIASNILMHLPTLTTGQEVIAYSKSQTVMAPIQRWTREGRTGLVTSVKSAFTERLAALRGGNA